MSPLVTVRPADSTDVPTLVAFNQQLATETEGKTLDDATLEAGVRRALASPGLCAYFVALAGDERVGQVMVTYELTDWRDGVIWWIQSVYVAPPHRRQGVLRALFTQVRRLAQADPDARGLRLYVERQNTRARRAYEALGLVPCSYDLLEHDWSEAIRQTR